MGTDSGSPTGTQTAGESDSTAGPTTGPDPTTDPTTGPDPTTDATTGPDPTDSTTDVPTTTDATTDPGSESDTDTDTDGTDSDSTTGDPTDSGTESESESDSDGNLLWNTPNLWYSVDDALIYIELDSSDGSVVQLVHNQINANMPLTHGQNGITMLEDGSLLGSRESAGGTQIYHIAEPPITPNTPAEAVVLGMVPNDMQNQNPLRIEALYTDCDGRVYLMDTGVNVGSAEGNRLLRFTGDYLNGDLNFEVITDLENASVADIDDMSPGLVDGEINDSIGFAMDSTVLWQLDYTTGTGQELAGTDGTWGIHAIGGPLFDDLMPRVYILSAGDGQTGAELMEVYINDYSNSQPLIEGPDLDLQSGYNGWSGLAGPLTECMTTIPQ